MVKSPRNKPVAGHAVDLLLDCGHVNVEKIEAVVFLPNTGEMRVCNTCRKQSIIKRVGQPYWLDEE